MAIGSENFKSRTLFCDVGYSNIMSPSPIITPKSRLSWLIATFFGIGHLQPGSGTWASAVTIAVWWAASLWISSAWLIPVAIAVSVLVTLIGIPPSTVVAR